MALQWDELRDLRCRDYPGLSVWAQCNHRILIRGRQWDNSQRRRCDLRGRSQSDVVAGRGPTAMGYRHSLEAGRWKVRMLFLSLARKNLDF